MKSIPNLTDPATYRIQIAGRISHNWSDYFMELRASHIAANGAIITELTGTVHDQAALFGLILRIRDLGLALILVEYLERI